MDHQSFGLLILIVVRGRRGLRRSTMAHNGFVASLGGPGTIVPKLGALLTRGIHEPEIERDHNH
jgi:hypothetical protein